MDLLTVVKGVLDRWPSGSPGGRGGQFRPLTGGRARPAAISATTRGEVRNAHRTYRRVSDALRSAAGRAGGDTAQSAGVRNSARGMLPSLLRSHAKAKERLTTAIAGARRERAGNRLEHNYNRTGKLRVEAEFASKRGEHSKAERLTRLADEAERRTMHFDREMGGWRGRIGKSMAPADVHTDGPVDVSRRPKKGKKKPGEVEVTMSVEKSDVDQRMVWGWASVTKVNGRPLIDLQGDIIETEELQKAVHEFVRKKRVMGDMHTVIGVGDVVDSIVLTEDLQKAMGIELGKEGWFVGVHVTNDNTWGKIKKGELTGFSIGGFGVRETVAEGEVSKAAEEIEAILALAEELVEKTDRWPAGPPAPRAAGSFEDRADRRRRGAPNSLRGSSLVTR